MAKPSALEQYTLELINRARIDPFGEYDRLVTNAPANVTSAINFFKVDLNVLRQQFNALTAVAPLAWNENLAAAASGHSAAMIAADQQSHQLPGEASLSVRFTNAGYNFTSAGENVYAFANDPFHAHAGFFIDWGNTATGIQDGAGHRTSIMSSKFVEVGVGYLLENNPATQVGTDVITHNFGNRSGYLSQLTGVAINDLNGDDFYNVGEGLSGVVVSAVGAGGTFTTTTWDSGGYNLEVVDGTYQVSFSYGAKKWTTTATVSGQNVKVDTELANMVSQVSNGTQDSVYDVSRFYNSATGAHFYTASDAERDSLIASGGTFVYEGNAFDSNATMDTGLIVFRLYNTQTGVHFYTASAEERASIAANLPQFNDEGEAYYAYAEGGVGRQALHRFYNTDNGTHFYTASDAEQQQVATTLPQYQYEGVAYYVEIA